MKHLEGEDTPVDLLPKKFSKNVYFLPENRHLKP
jgi:hypothetical protein